MYCTALAGSVRGDRTRPPHSYRNHQVGRTRRTTEIRFLRISRVQSERNRGRSCHKNILLYPFRFTLSVRLPTSCIDIDILECVGVSTAEFYSRKFLSSHSVGCHP
ncbi:hypothetical protein K474DRAFT_133333 [Panus rudis PR-1116 ss-1]|nr:hypothetical protein K474DRAFT_133333 [Panus rudis PR-1116 ss-1]